MTGYTRQSEAEIVDGQIINASDFNTEYDQLEAAFDGTTGHAHTGGSGDGAKIILTTGTSGILPLANGGTGISALTPGSIPFSNGTIFTQDNANLFYDDTNNRLGLGINTPLSEMHIHKAASANVEVRFTNTTTTLAAGYSVGVAADGTGYVWNYGNAGIEFGTNNQFAMFLNPSGNFSIGNTNNTYKLDVTGTCRISTDLTVGGNLGTSGIVTAGSITSGQITSNTAFISTGAGAGYQFNDRVSSTPWVWYSTSNIARIWNGADRFTIDASGNVITGGNITAGGGTVTAAQLTSTNVTASGTITAVNVQASNQINANFYDCDGSRVIDTGGGTIVYYKPSAIAGLSMSGILSTYDNNDHVFRNTGLGNTFLIDASGNTNTIGNAFVGFDTSTLTLNVRTTTTLNGQVVITNSSNIIPQFDNDSVVGAPGNTFAGMYAYGFVVTSDANLKADIEDTPESLDLVRAIEPKTFTLPGSRDPTEKQWGFIAQQVGAMAQDQGKDFAGYKVSADPITGELHRGLDIAQLLALLWTATKELAAKVEALEAKVVK